VISGFESGQKDITLPQLETLARLYGRPVTYFLQDEVPPDEPPVRESHDIVRQRALLRQKLIGVQLRQARQCAGKSLKDVAKALGVSGRRVNQYECGQRDVPLSELETLAAFYSIPLETFFLPDAPVPHPLGGPAPAAPPDSPPAPCPEPTSPAPVVSAPEGEAAPTGEGISESTPPHDLSHLDPAMREFIAKPVNLLYLQAAVRLSRLSVHDLRALGESLLEITY
jgi:transcriptional regulator with XRE-family HTH domain